MITKRKLASSVLKSFLLLLVLYNCKHIDLSNYPKESRTLFLHNFTNDSFQPDTNIEVFRSTRRELERRDNFILKRDKSEATLELYGNIRAFQQKGLMFDDLQTPTRLSLIAVCKIRVYKKNSSQRQLIFSEELAARVEVSLEIGSRQNEKSARLRLSRLLAQKIANALEKNFISNLEQKL